MTRKLVLVLVLTLAIAGVASAQYVYQLDDGSPTGGGVGPSADWSVILINHFIVEDGASTIVSVEACWHGASGPDHEIVAAVWSDPNQDGDPADAVLLSTSLPTLSDHASFCNVFDLQEPVDVGVDGTHFFVGVSWEDGPVGSMILQIDGSPGSSNSWFGESPDAPDLNDLQNLYLVEDNYFIRAYAPVAEEWVVTYDSPGSDDDEAYAITVDDLDNVYVAGYSTNSEGYDQWLTVKYDTDGVEQWSATHSGNGGDDDYAYAIAVDGMGNVYVSGEAYNSGTRSDITTIKYDSNGVEQWVAVYNGSTNDRDSANDIAVDGSGNVFVTGYITGNNPSGPDFWDCITIMYDANGTEQWVNIYDGSGNDRDSGVALVIDGSSNVFVSGYARNAAGDRDGLTIMYDSSGVQQWLNTYDGDFHGSDQFRDITLDGLGNVVITGSTEITLNNHQCLTVQYNSSGVEQWATIYNGVEDVGAAGNCIASDGSGNTYVGGDTDTAANGHDFCTIQYDSNGVAQWVATYNGTADGHEEVDALVVDGLGNIYVTGEVTNTGTGADYATVMYNSLGVEQWAVVYNGDADDDDKPYALAVDGSGNVFVTGYSYDATGYVNWATIKYKYGPIPIATSVDEGSSLPSLRCSLVAVPNPFNPTTEISFSLGASTHTVLSIHDVRGRLVRVLQEGTLGAGQHVLNWDGRDGSGKAQPSGVYLSRLVEDGIMSGIGKLVLCK